MKCLGKSGLGHVFMCLRWGMKMEEKGNKWWSVWVGKNVLDYIGTCRGIEVFEDMSGGWWWRMGLIGIDKNMLRYVGTYRDVGRRCVGEVGVMVCVSG